MSDEISIQPISTFSKQETVVISSHTHIFSNCLRYSNLSELDPSFYRHMTSYIYRKQTVCFPSVNLFSLNDDIVLFGGGAFLLGYTHSIVQSRVDPSLIHQPNLIKQLISSKRTPQKVGMEILVVARFGIYTWGHWLGELLPQVVIAERFFPGRFLYALPDEIIEKTDSNVIFRRIIETLAAYGVGVERVYPISVAVNYHLTSGYVIDPFWTDNLINGAVTNIMRQDLRRDHQRKPHTGKLGITRIPQFGRDVSNSGMIQHIFEEDGFTFHEMGNKTFIEQTYLFENSSFVYGTLGSDLTCLIFSPDLVQVITVAPYNFGDSFFYALIADRDGGYCDIRGIPLAGDAAPARSTRFYVPEDAVRHSIALLNHQAQHRSELSTDADADIELPQRKFLPAPMDLDAGLYGQIEVWTHDHFSGWLVVDDPTIRFPCIEIVIHGEVQAVVNANIFRQDLLDVGISDGICGFDLRVSTINLLARNLTFRTAITNIQLEIEPGGRIKGSRTPRNILRSQFELYKEFDICVNLIHDYSMIGVSVCVLPFALELAGRFRTRVRIVGNFSSVIIPLLKDLPIIIDSKASAGSIQFNANVGEARSFAAQNGMHIAQAFFILAKLIPPPLPIEIPFFTQPSDLPSGLVICPFTASERGDPNNHVRTWYVDRWIAVVEALYVAGKIEAAYLIGGTEDQFRVFEHPLIKPIIGAPLPVVVDLMRNAPLCITVDTGPSHLAHFGNITRHLLLYPDFNPPRLATNPRGSFIQGKPAEIEAQAVISEALRLIG